MSDSANLTEYLEEIETVISEQEEKVALGNQLNYLLTLPEFKSIIGDGYLKYALNDAVTIITDTLDPKSQEVREALDKIASVNRLKEYFEGIMSDAIYAPGRIEQEQDFRREYTAENSEVIDE